MMLSSSNCDEKLHRLIADIGRRGARRRRRGARAEARQRELAEEARHSVADDLPREPANRAKSAE
jgi:hypothetical protein